MYVTERLKEEKCNILDLLKECSNSKYITHGPIKDLLQYVLKYFSSVANIQSQSEPVCRLKKPQSVEDAGQQAADRERQRRVRLLALLLYEVISYW